MAGIPCPHESSRIFSNPNFVLYIFVAYEECNCGFQDFYSQCWIEALGQVFFDTLTTLVEADRGWEQSSPTKVLGLGRARDSPPSFLQRADPSCTTAAGAPRPHVREGERGLA